ncbi:hypothetical protein ACFQ0G_24430 [Streptomyces chiangmaiensis]
MFADGAQGENMSLELFSTVLARLETIPFQQLHINGGEPTVHRDFPALSDAARTRLPGKVMVLGTNAITLARNKRIMEATLRSYDQVLIGCDDEHENYDEVHAVVPASARPARPWSSTASWKASVLPASRSSRGCATRTGPSTSPTTCTTSTSASRPTSCAASATATSTST